MPESSTPTPAGRLLRFARKLKGRSVEELTVRTRQAAGAWIERHLEIPSTGEPGPEAVWATLAANVRAEVAVGDDTRLLKQFQQSPNRFFRGFDDREATIRALRDTWPKSEQEIVRRADEIAEGFFNLLGYDRLSLGTRIDWHRDPISGRTAPRAHWSRIPYLDAKVVGDHKVIWELNRHQYFLTLGRAYWLTGNERYARIIAEHLAAWMDENPPKIGINWSSSLEVAFRAMSWVWTLHFLKTSPSLTPTLFRRVLASLNQHARHVEAYLSTYFSPNTHLTGEALGLFVVGASLPQLSGADRWRRVGQSILEEQLPRQIRPDGVYVEQSTYYQRYTADFYLHASILAERLGVDVHFSDERLQSALDHLATVTRPDGSIPLIGDDDGGRLLALDDTRNDNCHAVFSTAAAWFERSDYAWVASAANEETLWLLGPEAIAAFSRMEQTPPAWTSREFADGGFYVMRDGWGRDASVAVIDAGPHGFLNAGHAHADALGFDLTIGGAPLLIDPGTFSYVEPVDRDRFRSTAAHNCVTVDGESSSGIGEGPFLWKSMARAETTKWTVSSGFDLFVGRHDGFERLAPPVRHERTILFLKDRYWIVRDLIDSTLPRSATLHFHCAPGIEVTHRTTSAVRLEHASNRDLPPTILASFANEAQLHVDQDFVSPAYGKRVSAIVCELKATEQQHHDIVTFIGPRIRTVDMISGRNQSERAFRLEGDDFVDVFAFESMSGDVEAKAQWTVVRRDPRSGAAKAFLAVGCSVLRIDGSTIISSPSQIDVVEGEFVDGQWRSIHGTPLNNSGSIAVDRARLLDLGDRSGRALSPSKD